jgi:hypothetical protein
VPALLFKNSKKDEKEEEEEEEVATMSDNTPGVKRTMGYAPVLPSPVPSFGNKGEGVPGGHRGPVCIIRINGRRGGVGGLCHHSGHRHQSAWTTM